MQTKIFVLLEIFRILRNDDNRKARKIMSEHLKRKLNISEIVHHIDENPFNNNILNLQIVTPEEHGSIHGGRPHKKKRTAPAWNRTPNFIREQVKNLYKKKRFTYSTLGKMFNISDNTIKNIILNR